MLPDVTLALTALLPLLCELGCNEEVLFEVVVLVVSDRGPLWYCEHGIVRNNQEAQTILGCQSTPLYFELVHTDFGTCLSSQKLAKIDTKFFLTVAVECRMELNGIPEIRRVGNACNFDLESHSCTFTTIPCLRTLVPGKLI